MLTRAKNLFRKRQNRHHTASGASLPGFRTQNRDSRRTSCGRWHTDLKLQDPGIDLSWRAFGSQRYPDGSVSPHRHGHSWRSTRANARFSYGKSGRDPDSFTRTRRLCMQSHSRRWTHLPCRRPHWSKRDFWRNGNEGRDPPSRLQRRRLWRVSEHRLPLPSSRTRDVSKPQCPHEADRSGYF